MSPVLTAAPVGTPGAAVFKSVSGGTQTLVPATGSGYAVGDLLFCMTAANKTTAVTVSASAGWTKICDDAGQSGYRIAGFAKVAASTSEPAPTITWSNLPAQANKIAARVCALRNLDVSDLASISDKPPIASYITSDTAQAAGGGIINSIALESDFILSLTARFGANDLTPPAGYTNVSAHVYNTSVAMTLGWAYKRQSGPSNVPGVNFAVSGGGSYSSIGIQLALKAAPSGVIYNDAPDHVLPPGAVIGGDMGQEVHQPGILGYDTDIFGRCGRCTDPVRNLYRPQPQLIANGGSFCMPCWHDIDNIRLATGQS